MKNHRQLFNNDRPQTVTSHVLLQNYVEMYVHNLTETTLLLKSDLFIDTWGCALHVTATKHRHRKSSLLSITNVISRGTLEVKNIMEMHVSF